MLAVAGAFHTSLGCPTHHGVVYVTDSLVFLRASLRSPLCLLCRPRKDTFHRRVSCNGRCNKQATDDPVRMCSLILPQRRRKFIGLSLSACPGPTLKWRRNRAGVGSLAAGMRGSDNT